ncbi:hypothetical protein GUITHDRAFT_119080 [Guillardia theta CCMP2712]|uniref:Uncharacterized protein n=1 Tax=Guillardia theta (strain CCMP2712) TaxID=905079 RepID=L1IG38_GUITC|nr:hypothetical protein GUITHDRAFT_119080 [Guillardia theta CCMP2712]EKX34770.1 hypothetical protein GUITHDRAFT_119080 [Guillardia theta CCMP2712]|eukprot:XP_005821750.1 hypothetical protein GUITHDRAFT_119080 [Guillardia theta CCMP2712]
MSFEKALEDVPGNTRAIPKDVMRRVIEKASGIVDTVDVSKDGRPAVSQEELTNYIKALPGLWSETCDNDAVETANGECLVPLDMDNFDLSESVAVFGMCLRDHCGIGGVCFWDTPTTPTSSKPKEW